MSTPTAPNQPANGKRLPAPRPADNLNTLRDMLDRSKQQIAMALPKHMTAERMIRVCATAVQRTPALLECTPLSIVSCVLQAAELGLELTGPLGQVYLVPRKNSKVGAKEATFQIGYRGFITLAFRSARVSFFNAHEVRERDLFDYSYGTRQFLKHKPAKADRGGVIAFYSVFRLIDGAADFEVMSLDEVKAHRDRYSYKPQYGEWVWDTCFEEMGKKTLIRKLAKRAPISIEIMRAAAIDEYGEAGVPQELPIPVDGSGKALATPTSRTDQIAADINGEAAGAEDPQAGDLEPDQSPSDDQSQPPAPEPMSAEEEMALKDFVDDISQQIGQADRTADLQPIIHKINDAQWVPEGWRQTLLQKCAARAEALSPAAPAPAPVEQQTKKRNRQF